MKFETVELYEKLENIFDHIPSGKCSACGECCVNPSITLVEFIYVYKHLIENYSTNNIEKILLTPLNKSIKFKGNKNCPFLVDKKCSIHSYRPVICRLQGLDVLNHLGIEEQENCPYFSTLNKLDFEVNDLNNLRTDLDKINQYLYKLQKPPFYFYGFDIISWISILSLKQSKEKKLHRDIRKIQDSFFDYIDVDSDLSKKIFRKDYVNIEKYLNMAKSLDELIKKSDIENIKVLINEWENDPHKGLYMYAERKNIIDTLGI